MADGSSGGLSGVLFEAGKTISDAGKKQAQQVANAVGQQVTGSAKPLFGGTPKSSGTFTPKPLGGSGGATPKLDPFGDFGKMFEKNKPGGMFGAKQPPVPPTPQFTQEDLDKMAAENSAKDQEEIAKRQAELRQLQQHLHNENYYNAIRDAGKDSIAKERQAKQQAEQQEEEAKAQQAAQQGQDILPGNPLAQNQQLGTPVSVQQAKTQTEANRGTTG